MEQSSFWRSLPSRGHKFINLLGSGRFFYCVHKSPPPVRNVRHMNADHKVTDSAPKMMGPYRQSGECSLQRHTLGPQNDPFHLVGSLILKEIFRGMWIHFIEQT
jgi:hypothetical protein